MSTNTGNPFARNSRATGRAPYTFGRGPQAPLRPHPTQNFPVPPNHHVNNTHRAPAPQVNQIPRAPGHAPNPFQQHAPPPLPPRYHTGPYHRTNPLPTDEAYARQQATSYTCACPVRLYANHAELCTGPAHPRAHITPLGRLGNAGSAVASVPPLVWLAAAVVAVARACLLRVGGVLAGVAAALGAVLQWVGVAAPVVAEWVVLLVGLAVLGVVVWWGAVTAANVYMWAVTWRRPAEYYTLRQGFLFLGTVSPPAGARVASHPPPPLATLAATELPVCSWRVDLVKRVTSYIAPVGTFVP